MKINIKNILSLQIANIFKTNPNFDDESTILEKYKNLPFYGIGIISKDRNITTTSEYWVCTDKDRKFREFISVFISAGATLDKKFAIIDHEKIIEIFYARKFIEELEYAIGSGLHFTTNKESEYLKNKENLFNLRSLR